MGIAGWMLGAADPRLLMRARNLLKAAPRLKPRKWRETMTRETKWARIAMPAAMSAMAAYGPSLAAAGGCPQPGGNRSLGPERRKSQGPRREDDPFAAYKNEGSPRLLADPLVVN